MSFFGISRTWASITLIPVFYLFVLPHPAANALEIRRELVQDTLVIPIADPEGLPPLDLAVDSLLDRRPEPGSTLGRYEKNNYVIIPVDLLLRSEKPLADHLAALLPTVPPGPDTPSISLAVEHLRLDKKTNSMLYPHYRLNAAVKVISNAGESNNLGTLIYDCTFRKPAFGDRLETGIASAVALWGKEFYDDLSLIADNPSLDRFSTLENFRSGALLAKPVNMLGGLEFYAGGGGGWMLDGDICFSPREARKRYHRSGYVVRYRRSKDYDSIEFGTSDDRLYYRINRTTVLRGYSRLFFGVNRWDDILEKDHKIFDAFIVDYSLGQGLYFNPRDRTGLTAGVGLMESVYYVYQDGFRFQLALSVHLGVKL